MATAVWFSWWASEHYRGCIAKAHAHGLAAVAVRCNTHYGVASYCSLMCLEHDMIGISLTNNAGAGGVPTSVSRPMMESNPISVVAPTNQEPLFELDMASSVAAAGKTVLALAKGASIPIGWALDKQCRPPNGPQAATDAVKLLTLGGTREIGSQRAWPGRCD